MPPRCDSTDFIAETEEVCASLSATTCNDHQACCWSMMDPTERQKCVPVAMEHCPQKVMDMFKPKADTGSGASTDAATGDAGADATTGADATGDAGTDASTVDATGDTGADATTGADGSTGASAPAKLPFMVPNPPMNERTMTLFGCEALTMQGKDKCNQAVLGGELGHVCGWSVKEFECQEIELGHGNLCKTVDNQDACNKQGDCCWDMKGYCGEFDFGDCFRGGMPGMPSVPTGNMAGMGNIAGMGMMGGMEEVVEMQSEQAERNSEIA